MRVTLQGKHHYLLDEKGRFKLPNEFLVGLGTGFTLTRGVNGCLWAMPDDEWLKMRDRLAGTSMVDERSLALQRYFLGAAERITPDTQGRITIPPTLRADGGIGRDIVIVGVGNRMEIWSRESWERYDAELSDERIRQLAMESGL